MRAPSATLFPMLGWSWSLICYSGGCFALVSVGKRGGLGCTVSMWEKGLAVVFLLGGSSLFHVARGREPKTARGLHDFFFYYFYFLNCIIVHLLEAVLFRKVFLYLSLALKCKEIQGKKSLASLANSMCWKKLQVICQGAHPWAARVPKGETRSVPALEQEGGSTVTAACHLALLNRVARCGWRGGNRHTYLLEKLRCPQGNITWFISTNSISARLPQRYFFPPLTQFPK